MDQIPAYRVPESPRSLWRRYLPLALVLAAIAIVACVYAFVPSVRDAVRYLFLPSDVRQAVYVSDRGQAAYALKAGQYVPAASFMVVQQADGTYAIHDPSGVSLTFTGAAKADLAVSPDGTGIAYAELNDGASAPRSFYGSPRNPSQWTAKVLYPGTGTTLILGEGMVPAFVDDTHVLRRTSRGIFLTDLVSGETTLVLEDPQTLVLPALTISPDGRYFAIVNPVPEKETVSVSAYRLEGAQATLVSQHAYDAPPVSFAMGNDALYSVRIGTETEIWSEGLDEGVIARRVNTAPLSLDLSRILLSR